MLIVVVKIFSRMKKVISLSVFLFFFMLTFSLAGSSDVSGNKTGWKAGVARIDITPKGPLWMSGYAGRDHACGEKLHSLWVKALSLEDADGNLAVLVTMDLALLTRAMSDTIKNRLYRKYRLNQSQIILSWSHTHTGPVVRDEVFYDWLNLDQGEIEKIEKYSDLLENQIVHLVGKALESMMPVNISSGNGVTRFAVNRRNNVEAEINPVTNLNGPVDHSVPVIKVTKPSGEVLALVFGYACHSTTLNSYQWSGDYPGFAQIALEKTFPGTTAMFFAGCGADQNPLPRRSVGLAQQYGKTLAAAVEAVVSEPMKRTQSRNYHKI